MNGTTSTPQAPWFWMRLALTVSLRPPARIMPVPTGPRAAEPERGTFGLLLSWMKFRLKNVHDPVPRGPRCPFGQAPLCGDGASSLFWLLVEMPHVFPVHSERSTIRWPPEFVPE